MNRYAIRVRQGATPSLLSAREDAPRWVPGGWSWGVPLGDFRQGGKAVVRQLKPQVHVHHGTAYDARILTPEAEAHVQAVEAEIARLRLDLAQYVRDHFLEWEPGGAGNLEHLNLGRHATKAEAVASLKAQGYRP